MGVDNLSVIVSTSEMEFFGDLTPCPLRYFYCTYRKSVHRNRCNSAPKMKLITSIKQKIKHGSQFHNRGSMSHIALKANLV